MRLRIISISFLLGTLATGIAWLPLQPSLLGLLRAVEQLAEPGSSARALADRVRLLLPVWLGLALMGTVVLLYVLLQVSVGRPLSQTEALVERVGQPDLLFGKASSGPLLSRVHAALRRGAEALEAERQRTREQMQALVETNQRLSRTQAELVASERLATVGRLAAAVAHEVGNPLSGILGYVSLLGQGGVTPGQVHAYTGLIEAEVRRIDGIVRGLLDLGRPAPTRPRPLELKRQVDSIVRLVAAGRDFGGIEVLQEVPDGLVASADPGALAQVFINLLLNAAHAMEGRGRIRVGASAMEGEVAIVVEDEGPGIPPEVLPRVFEPFFSTKEPGHGTGLGLAIAQHLATQQSGRLTAENLPGGGARFSLYLQVP